jgi:Na+(H+)/acetate symporter ActP
MSFVSASEASRTVSVVIIQAGWDFWAIFWAFLTGMPVVLWLAVRTVRRYSRNVKARAVPEGHEPRPSKRGD